MLEAINNNISYNFNQCQQCGICYAVCPKKAITLSTRPDGLHDIIINQDICIRCGKCVKSCPANKENNYNNYFDKFKQTQYYLGFNKNNDIRHKASSGGVCKTIIIEALKNNIVDGVYSLRKTDIFPFAEGEFYTRDNIPAYDDIPNSIYHSIMACTEIHKIKPCHRLMLIGTSCQLRALNTVIQGKYDEVIRVCIFCKQQKSLESTRFLAKIIGTKISDIKNHCPSYRGEGWPGVVKIKESQLPWNRAAQIPFGRRLWTIPGCDVCGDSFGKNAKADFALMDPWKIRTPNNLGETLITIFTKKGDTFLKSIKQIELCTKNYNEVKAALGLKDVWRKQQTEPYFRGKNCNSKIKKAGEAELKQRKLICKIVNTLPRMPIIFYRILCKFPLDKRNRILK